MRLNPPVIQSPTALQNPAEALKERVSAILNDTENHARWAGRPVREPKKKPAQKKSDFNKRSADYMRDRGYHAYRADYFDARMGQHHDFLGIFDFVCFGQNETVGLQITSRSNVSSHRTKILNAIGYRWAKQAGWRILLLSWDSKTNDAREEWL